MDIRYKITPKTQLQIYLIFELSFRIYYTFLYFRSER